MSLPVETIKAGDVVSVNFHNAQFTLCSRGVVIYTPLNPEDSWVIRDDETRVVHYVSESCTVSKRINGEEGAQ